MKTTTTNTAPTITEEQFAHKELLRTIREVLDALNTRGAMGFAQDLSLLHSYYTTTMDRIKQPTLRVDAVWRDLQEDADFFFKQTNERVFLFTQLTELLKTLDDLDKRYRIFLKITEEKTSKANSK